MKITVKFEPKDLPPFVVDTEANDDIHPSVLAIILAGALHDAAFQFYFAIAKRSATEDTDEVSLREKTYHKVDQAFRSIIQD